jgi:hypothetical protein
MRGGLPENKLRTSRATPFKTIDNLYVEPTQKKRKTTCDSTKKAPKTMR